MRRFHVHIAVDDLEKNVRFYSSLFNMEPTRIKDDYVQWILDDPRVNFAISERGRKKGLDHLGFQVDSDEELRALAEQMRTSDLPLETQEGTSCCYAQSDKHWTVDPQGIAWETFHTLRDAESFLGNDAPQPTAGSCCAPSSGGCCA